MMPCATKASIALRVALLALFVPSVGLDALGVAGEVVVDVAPVAVALVAGGGPLGPLVVLSVGEGVAAGPLFVHEFGVDAAFGPVVDFELSHVALEAAEEDSAVAAGRG